MRSKKLILLLLPLATAGFWQTLFGQTLKVQSVSNPANAGSLQAQWSTTPDGSPILSWIETLKDGSYTLQYSIRKGAQWTTPRIIVAKRNFFRQPAEAPEVISFADGSLLAEWVEIPNEKSGAEFIYVSASKDGQHWTQPAMANKDRSPVQHALVSMVASGDREASLVWLEALKGEDAPSVLKRTLVNGDGMVIREETLDSDVCTCCPTAIVKTARGLLVAYRDHTPQDIRDIGIIRFENGKWLPSKILNPDKWEINACPVNGASIAARDNRVAIAWYTEAQDSPRTQMVFSSDGGATFGKPILVSTGNSFGYASVALDDAGGATVSWLEEPKAGGAIRLMVRPITNAGVAGTATQVVQGSRQALGYPRLLHTHGETWLAWGSTRVTTVLLAK